MCISCFSYAQTNLVDTSNWTVGDGATPGFTIQGQSNENIREMGIGPDGNSVLLWKSAPNGSTGYDGGWKTSFLPPIDHTKKYRFSIWLKKTNSSDGTPHFGMFANNQSSGYTTLRLNGSVVNNAYFFVDDLPQLNQWYLLVGFVHGSAHTSTINEGRIYDVSGSEVGTLTDFKFTTDAYYIRHRSFLYNDSNTSDGLYHHNPTVYEVNGQEPTISELLNLSGSSDTQPPSAPTLSNTGQTDTTVHLSWSGATDNVGVTGYKIFKDGNLEATLGNVNTYQVTGLTASTAYSFTVTALDAAGNESVPSSAVSVTTDSTSGGGGSGGSVWSESNSVASYSGNVAIGTSSAPSGYKLAVDGHIRTREIRVDQDAWPDYVFKEGYDLPTLEEIERYIEEKGHLPNVPSAKEVHANGVELGEMDRLLLEKIEELTMYILQLENDKKEMEKRINKLEKQQK